MPARSRHAAAAAVLATAVAAVATSAGAQSAKPAPGCAGMTIVDAKGDAKRTSPSGGGAAAGGNLDITGIFFTHEGGKTFANMQLADAGDAMPDDTLGLRWYINFTAKGSARWVRAARNVGDSGEAVFEYGHWEETSRITDGDTAGSFVTGADGVLRLQIPSGSGGTAGTQLTKIFADTAEVLPNHEEPVSVGVPPGRNNRLYIADRAPEGEAFGPDHAVGVCPTAGDPNTGGGGGGSTGGGSTGGGSTGGGGTDAGGTPPPANQVDEPAALPVKVSGKGGSARKVSKKKKLTLSITASQPVKNVVARLFTGDPAKPKVLGQAKLAQLSSKGKLKFKIKKKLKRGTVALRVDGTLADGRKGIANFNVRFGK